MKAQINDRKAPVNTCMFTKISNVQFSDGGDGTKEYDFLINLYSGEIILNHWFWENLAFDLKGLSFAKEVTPVLDTHISEKRIGFSISQSVTDAARLAGNFLTNSDATRIKNDLKEGFPMEASGYIPPLIIERVEAGQSVEVNGHTLEGPGHVFRKAVIKEASMCNFGWSPNTQSKAFADGGNREIEFSIFSKEYKMAKEQTEKTLTVETFAAENKELFEQINKAAGEKADKAMLEKFGELKTACGDDMSLLVECFEAGKSVNEALQMANEKLREANTKLAETATAATNEIAAGKNKGDENKQTQTLTAAEQEFSDKQGEPTKKTGDKVDEFKMSEDELKKKFAESKELQAEFAGNEASYLAFVKADKGGKVKILGEKKK